MTICYSDILITVIPDDINFMLTKIYQTIHGIISNSEEKVGVGFPDWHDHELDDRGNIKRGGIGSTIRLFGSLEQLSSFLEEPALKHYISIRCARAYPIQQTPETASYVRFARDRKSEKKKGLYLDRRKRRRERRGTTYKKNPESLLDKNIHFINMTSQENGNRFCLFVKREICDNQGNSSFTNYGLCKKDTGLPNF